MALLVYLLPWMGCLQLALLYPTGEDTSPLIARYGLRLAKKDVDGPLKDSLLSAILMAEMPKDAASLWIVPFQLSEGGLWTPFLYFLGSGEFSESQKQRKKAVDSTFIRFGRSSWPGNGRHLDDSTPVEEIEFFTESRGSPANSERMSYGNNAISSGEVEGTAPEILSPSDSSSSKSIPSGFPNGCRLANNGDLVRALLGNSCVRLPQKVKRENVNDTFIRFGKRDSSRRLVRSTNERADHDT